MEAVARVRHIRVTPMKARRVVNMIRGKQANEALAILKFAPQGASDPVYKLVASAIANARVKADASNSYLDEQDLVIAKAYVDEGTTLKRFQPRAQGRAFQIKKRTSHITVVLATPAVAESAPVTTTKKARASILMVGWLDTNSPMPLANSIIKPTEATTAAIMMATSSTMPTAVMMESSENTKSITIICKMTDVMVLAVLLAACSSSPSSDW